MFIVATKRWADPRAVMSGLSLTWGRLAPKWDKSGIFSDQFQSQNVLKLILKSPRFAHFGANMTQFGWQICHPLVWWSRLVVAWDYLVQLESDRQCHFHSQLGPVRLANEWRLMGRVQIPDQWSVHFGSTRILTDVLPLTPFRPRLASLAWIYLSSAVSERSLLS